MAMACPQKEDVYGHGLSSERGRNNSCELGWKMYFEDLRPGFEVRDERRHVDLAFGFGFCLNWYK